MPRKPPFGRQNYPRRKDPSQASRVAALRQIIIMREDLDSLNLESLERSYNMPKEEIARLIANEKFNRATAPKGD